MAFFVFEVFFAGYVLLNLALVAEHFLMPSLLNISKRYKLSRDVTGIVVAIGNSVPELTTTMLSFMKHGVKMTEFGIASNIGCGVLTITVVPAIAILATMGSDSSKHQRQQGVHVSKKKLAIEAEVRQRSMMLTIYRDMGFFILSLILYDLILLKGVVYIYEVFFVIGVLGLYGLSIVLVNRYSQTLEKQITKRPRFISENEADEGSGQEDASEMEVIMVQKREVGLTTFENP